MFPKNQIRVYNGQKLKFVRMDKLKDGSPIVIILKENDKETALSVQGWESLKISN